MWSALDKFETLVQNIALGKDNSGCMLAELFQNCQSTKCLPQFLCYAFHSNWTSRNQSKKGQCFAKVLYLVTYRMCVNCPDKLSDRFHACSYLRSNITRRFSYACKQWVAKHCSLNGQSKQEHKQTEMILRHMPALHFGIIKIFTNIALFVRPGLYRHTFPKTGQLNLFRLLLFCCGRWYLMLFYKAR